MRALGRAMVASPHYLATGAGVSVLRRGGSAVDAAIAVNSVLAVVTPYMCGIGGDLFAIVYDAASGSLAGLNGSGRAPGEATVDRMRELAGGDSMPAVGPLTITVPGCVDAWGRLHERFGRLPLTVVLDQAIRYARDGFPVSAEFSREMEANASGFHPDTPARETYLPGGSAPSEGSILRLPRLAATLTAVAEDGPDAYYRGPVAREIVRAVRAVGGLLSEKDLADHSSDWVDLLSVTYRDVTVYEMPPNSQGMAALMILNILSCLPVDVVAEGGERWIHTLAEAARLAYADRDALVTDRGYMQAAPGALLSEEYARQRAGQVGERVSGTVTAGQPGDTAYFCTADADGNLVSMIESNYMGVGSGVMAGEAGFLLQNRGAWFSLDPEHVNAIAPGKRTMHTLMPGMAFRGGRPWLVFGTMGGNMQPQIHVEFLTRLIDQGMSLDDALAAPRFDAAGGDGDVPILALEGGFPSEVAGALQRRGHTVQSVPAGSPSMGFAHAIEILPDGVYTGASDPRTDSLALGY